MESSGNKYCYLLLKHLCCHGFLLFWDMEMVSVQGYTIHYAETA